MTSSNYRPLFLSLSPQIYLPSFLCLSPFSLFLSLPQAPTPHLLEQSRALQRYYRMHMVQNQNPSQASPGLFSYASSSFLVQAEFIQRQDEPRPNSH